jgi:hypothetical protein
MSKGAKVFLLVGAGEFIMNVIVIVVFVYNEIIQF